MTQESTLIMPTSNYLFDALTGVYPGWKFTGERIASIFIDGDRSIAVPSMDDTPWGVVDQIGSVAAGATPVDPALLVFTKTTTSGLGKADYIGSGKAWADTFHGYEPVFGIAMTISIPNGVSRAPLTFTATGTTLGGLAVSRSFTLGPFQSTSADNILVRVVWLPSVNVGGVERYVPLAVNGTLSGSIVSDGPAVTQNVSSGITVTYELLARGHPDLQSVLALRATAAKWVADWAWKGRRAADTLAASGTQLVEDAAPRAYNQMVEEVYNASRTGKI